MGRSLKIYLLAGVNVCGMVLYYFWCKLSPKPSPKHDLDQFSGIIYRTFEGFLGNAEGNDLTTFKKLTNALLSPGRWNQFVVNIKYHSHSLYSAYKSL